MENKTVEQRKIYIASKTIHAEKWRTLRSYGFNITSTWIDEAGEGDSTDLEDLCKRCIKESLECDAMIVYAEPGDYLKGAFIEMGVVLSTKSKPVFLVGDPLPSGSIFTQDSNVYKANSVEHALDIIKNQYDWSAAFIAGSKATESAGVWVKFVEWTHGGNCFFIYSKTDNIWYQYADMFEMSTLDLYNYYRKLFPEKDDESPSPSLLQQENERLRDALELAYNIMCGENPSKEDVKQIEQALNQKP